MLYPSMVVWGDGTLIASPQSSLSVDVVDARFHCDQTLQCRGGFVADLIFFPGLSVHCSWGAVLKHDTFDVVLTCGNGDCRSKS